MTELLVAALHPAGLALVLLVLALGTVWGVGTALGRSLHRWLVRSSRRRPRYLDLLADVEAFVAPDGRPNLSDWQPGGAMFDRQRDFLEQYARVRARGWRLVREHEPRPTPPRAADPLLLVRRP